MLDLVGEYFWFAERFGWEADAVDRCPQWIAARLPIVAAVHDEVAADKQKQAAKGAGS